VGIIGPNGAGKTTLLRLLLKETAPDAGRVRHGTRLQMAYFDQLRSQLDLQKNVRENIGEGNDFIVHNGQRRHVIGYLQDFLFTPERCRTPVYVLSGGEKNRLLLAKLFARPANVLVLDEPTNDLDVETLELLETLLVDFPGTLLLVSHDRAFLNNVVTSTIVFEGSARAVEYAGGYDDWLSQRPPGTPKPKPSAGQNARGKNKPTTATGEPRKLGYMQRRELTDLPRRIEVLEAEQQTLSARMSDPRLYQKDKTEIAAVKSRMDAVGSEIERAYRRWEELEGLSAHL
jgi:ATP-binding cassette subfamily F protein uup